MKPPTYEEIKPYIERKLVSEQAHPEDANVRIFNYTQKCQFDQAWDDVTRQCRGLILNVATGEVLARPFPKFFNYGEHVSKGWTIPTSTPIITEKLDGSLGILYGLNGKEWIATRGSFTSDQALWATDWWRKNVLPPFDYIRKFPQGRTHLFEIIYPENRIVVSYNFSGLVHLTTLDNETGKVYQEKWYDPIRTARKIETSNIEELAMMDEPNSEGFVVFYPEENIRMKIKFPEYVRLHRLVTGINEIAIWEYLRDGIPLNELIEKVPDEFFQWVNAVSTRLNDQYLAIEQEARNDYSEIIDGEDQDLISQRASWRKHFALKAAKKRYPGVLFAMLDSKPWSPIIWKMVRPHGAHVFKTDIDL